MVINYFHIGGVFIVRSIKKTIPAVIWVYGYGKGFMPTATEQQAQRGTYLKEFEPWPG